jgi:hypothetical protein
MNWHWLAPLFFSILVGLALWRGIMVSHFGIRRRDEMPVFYWFYVAIMGASALLTAFLAAVLPPSAKM